MSRHVGPLRSDAVIVAIRLIVIVAIRLIVIVAILSIVIVAIAAAAKARKKRPWRRRAARRV